MTKYIQVLLINLLIMSCSSSESDPDISSLQNQLNAFNEAYRKADVDKLQGMITKDYTHTNGSWEAFGKEKWLSYMTKRQKSIADGELEIHKYEMTNINIVSYKSSAFVTGKIISEGMEKNEPFKSEIRVSNYWVLTKEGWKRAGFHDTKIESE